MTKLINKHREIILITFILLFAFFLRVYKLSQTPDGFHADEASFYINALSISKTGADEDGVKYPLSLSSLIDPKPALFSYFEIPFINIFSDQIFASRLPSVILGILSIGIVFLLLKKLADEKVALVSTAVLAFSPWHIIVSRGTQEVVASFLFLILSI